LKNKTFYSHGKLLISGEYVVLDGALSLAIPTKFGQSLIVKAIEKPLLHWKSFDQSKNVWFENEFQLDENKGLKHNQQDDIAKRLIQIINATKDLNPKFLKNNEGFKIETHLEFPKNWGLGTSSTLINNMAQWANVDAFKLLEKTFGGSGYDIACAQNNTPITYKIDNKNPSIKVVNFNPEFKDNLYFVYLNKKQNSRHGIKHYHENKKNAQASITTINTITLEMTQCKTLEHFQNLMIEHETIISKITKQTPVKYLLFNDFEGAIKSLGAWGGDFILVASKNNPIDYFKNKGYETVIPYSDMAL
jgi:mevalonate kinase